MRAASEIPAKRPRDPRLDFFRGIAMFIIFLAHTPGNWWAGWIPARFGFSDATEIFVFCSGMASAIAFGRVFEERGVLMGTSRILFRAWQVYWAHIGLFLAVLVLMVGADKLLGTGNHYVASLNLQVFLEDAGTNLLGLLTLTYVPNYFDILPMYLVILLLVPVMVVARWQHPALPFVIVGALWAFAAARWLDLPAEPWSSREWFFNPFSWQLVFFTGFALMRGWLPKPPIDKRLVGFALVIVIGSIPVSWWRLLQFETFFAAHQTIMPFADKTTFGLVRYVHFLGLAYLGYCAATVMRDRLSGPVVNVIRKVGQQSLGVFLGSLVLAQVAGIGLDLIGRTWLNVSLVNVVCFGCLVTIAMIAAWFKSAPWQKPAPVEPQRQSDLNSGRSLRNPQPQQHARA